MIVIDENNFFEILNKYLENSKNDYIPFSTVKNAIQVSSRGFIVSAPVTLNIYTGIQLKLCGHNCATYDPQNILSCCICSGATATCSECLKRV